jgi:RNA polymerase sigma-70 factor (ECF subfamily)
MQKSEQGKLEIATVYTQFHQVLFRFIKSKINNHHDAEDILHNVFIKVANGINDLSRKEKLQSWIYSIARNAIIDHYRAKAGKRDIYYETEGDISQTFTDEEYNDTTKGLDCCLLAFVDQLPEEYRRIIRDVDLNGAKQKDLTEKYDLAYPSIRSRVQRGREKLKQLLLDCCSVDWDNRGNILEVNAKSCKHEGSNCAK